jgi:thiosulfate reductase cytochrome b subunit
MADPAYLPRLAAQASNDWDSPRHSAVVRVTHWIHALSFFALIVSGAAILIAHPRFYWGETGAVGTPALLELPLPFIFGHSGWGRYLHFLAAWVAVFNGSVYALTSLFDQHFRKHLLPSTTDLAWRPVWRIVRAHLRLERPGPGGAGSYNLIQQLAYLSVIFFLFPGVVVTGLAMSPAITSVIPGLVTIFGGQQSARTMHFLIASVLVLFLLVHIGMVCLGGFRHRVWAMITG